MNPESLQALVSAVLLAFGISLKGWIMGSVVAFSPGLFLATIGAVGLADYGLGMILTYWRRKPV